MNVLYTVKMVDDESVVEGTPRPLDPLETVDADSSLPSQETSLKPSSEQIVLPQKVVYSVGIGVTTILIGFLLWQINAVESLQNVLFPATAVVTVVDAETLDPLVGVTITLGDVEFQTGDDGVTVVDGLTTREYILTGELLGYVDYKETLSLERGRNNITIELDVFHARTDVGGKVYDYVDGSVIKGATVVYKDQEKNTQADGGFLFTDVPVGIVEIAVSKDGYNTQSLDVQLSSQYQIDINLVPEGKTVFVSNRDGGKRAIYTANFDGTGVVQLIQRSGETEDYGVVLSPQSQKVAFYSTRDEKMNTESEMLDPNLYVVSLDGKDLVKVGTHFWISNVSWSYDETTIVWLGRMSSEDYTNHLYQYSVVSGVVTQIDSGSVGTMMMNSKKTGYMWVETRPEGDPTATEGIYYYDLTTKTTTQISDQSSWSIGFAKDDSVVWFQLYDSVSGDYAAMAYELSTDTLTSIDSVSTEYSRDEFASIDETSVAYVETRDGKSDVYFSNTDGTNERKLTSLGTVANIIGWDKKGAYILFNNQSPTETAQYIVGLTGSSERKISDIHLESYGYGPGY